ncbi:helix-turn-helix domain-containing protein [Nostoc sp. CHAB 5844]|nr:helix-turn-helix domain-containing protein [Nostoc sp. CHAB 5844]
MSLAENQINNRTDFGAFIPSFLDDYPLEPEEFRLYAHIQRRAGVSGCFESLSKIAQHCHIALKTAKHAIKLLLDTSMIQVQKRNGTTNIYTLTPVSQWVAPEQVSILRQQIKHKKKSGVKFDPGQKCTQVKNAPSSQVKNAPGDGSNLTHKGNPNKGIPTKDSLSIVSLTAEQEKEKEKKAEFGFQIPESSNPKPSASLLNNSETSQLTNQTIIKANVPPPDPFFSVQRKKTNEIVWDWLPDGPWRTEDGKLDSEFQTAIANRWLKEYGGDLHANKAKVLKHFRNEPTNLSIEWEWYQTTFVHRVANIQTRRQHGLDTSSEEQVIAKQARAALPLPEQMRVTELRTPTEVVEQVADYALPNLPQNTASIAAAESMTTYSELPSFKELPTDEFGAMNDPNAYLVRTAQAEEIEFWNNFKPRVIPTSKKLSVSHEELAAAKAVIEELKAQKAAKEKSKKLTPFAEIINPPVKDEEALLQDMRKYLNSGSDVLRQKAIDWASDPNNQCQLVKVNGKITDIKWVDF